MNIVIINGTPDDGWKEYEDKLITAAEGIDSRHNVNLFTVRNMNINYCRGCFGCWVKTPGKCFYRDDMDEILDKYPKTDILFFATPLKAGFMTSETKKVMDRMIPTVLPYINLINNECHHPKRYDNEPALGLLVFDKHADIESFELNSTVIDRFAINFHAKKTIKILVTPESIKEVIENEISLS